MRAFVDEQGRVVMRSSQPSDLGGVPPAAIGCPGGAPFAVSVAVDRDRLELDALEAVLDRIDPAPLRRPRFLLDDVRRVEVPPALPLQTLLR